jgi:hypothetical protein
VGTGVRLEMLLRARNCGSTPAWQAAATEVRQKSACHAPNRTCTLAAGHRGSAGGQLGSKGCCYFVGGGRGPALCQQGRRGGSPVRELFCKLSLA